MSVWGTATDLGATADSTSGTNIQHFAAAAASVGDVVVVVVAKDNASTTDGNTNEVTSVTDNTAGGLNTYVKAREFCNSQGGANSGATVAIFYCKLVTALTTSTVFTANFSGTTAKSAISVYKWAYTGGTLSVLQGLEYAIDGGSPSAGRILLNGDWLAVRAHAIEANTAGIGGDSGLTTIFTSVASTGGGSAANMAVAASAGAFDIATTWNLDYTPQNIGGAIWYGGAYNGSRIVLVGGSLNYAIYSDDGGSTWSTSNNLPTTQYWVSVAWSGTNFVAVGQTGTAAAYSSDGITWSSATLPISGDWNWVVSDGAGTLVASYQNASVSNCAAYSTNHGQTWTQTTGLPVSLANRSLVWDGTYFLIFRVSGSTMYCYRSTNGSSWSSPYTVGTFTYAATWPTGATPAIAMIFDYGTATYYTSTDHGASWTSRSFTASGDSSPWARDWRAVTWVPKLSKWFLNHSTSGKTIAYTSSNGTTWASDGPHHTGTLVSANFATENFYCYINGNLPYFPGIQSTTSSYTAGSVDGANIFLALKPPGVINATANGATITATASLPSTGLTPRGYQTDATLPVTASLIDGDLYGPDATVPATTFTHQASLIAGNLLAGATVVSGGPMAVRLVLSGGGTNENPLFSRGGAPSLSFLGNTRGQNFSITAPQQITGLTILEGDDNPIGTGTLSWTVSNSRLRWTRPNGALDYAVIGGDGMYYIGTIDSYIVVNIVSGLLPLTDKTDSVQITARTQNIFDHIDYSQWSSGVTEYRGLYLRNISGSMIDSLTFKVQQQPTTGSVHLAFPSVYSSYGVMTSAEVDQNLVISPTGFDRWEEGSTLARTDTNVFFDPRMVGLFTYAAPKITRGADYFSDGIAQNLLDTIVNETDSTNVLAGMSWVTTQTFGGFPNGYYLPFWIRRTIPSGTPGGSDVDDDFKLALFYH